MSSAPRWFTIGAASDCDLRVDAPQVSGRHARLCAQPGGRWAIEDTGSTNGLWHRGQRVPSVVVGVDDVIGLGQLPVRVGDLVARLDRVATRPTGGAAGDVPIREVVVEDRPLVIGRDADCDIVLVGDAVSGRHARVFRNAGRVVLEDLGSRNGTHLRAAGSASWESYRSAVVRPDDVVRVGKQGFRFVDAVPQRRPGARVDVQNVELVVTHRATKAPLKLLAGVSFTALAGEVVGILGPSGSGKTSLLNVLAGFDAPTAGRVLVQGAPLHAAGRVVPGMGAVVGHAPQFDVAHELLTVEEAVRYSALLRGPATWSPAEVEARVTRAIEDVGLASRRTTPLGSETRKTLSGGQKKRVNIAMELVLDPPVLLLDEPSSGLSSHDTIELMALLRRLADQGRTVILTIHQPSYAAFVKMDQILLLEEGGHVAWFGPAAIDSFEFLGVTDREPGALLERMPKKASPELPGDLSRRFRTTDAARRFVEGRAAVLATHPPPPWPLPPAPEPVRSTGMLLQRNLAMKLRDPFFLVLTFGVPVLVSALFVAVLGAQVEGTGRTPDAAFVEHKYFVVLTILCCFFGALSASLEVVSELPILRRERRGGVPLASYVASKAVTFVIPAAIFPALALATLHLLAGDVMRGAGAAQWAVLAPTFLAAACAGLLLSSLLPSAQGVVVVAVFYAIVQVVFSVFVPLHVTDGSPPRAGWLRAASAPMTARWSLAGLVTTTDLCELDAAPPRDPAAALAAGFDMRTIGFWPECRDGLYRDHGLRDVETKAGRTAREAYRASILANLLLALAALGAAARVLDGRSVGTQ